MDCMNECGTELTGRQSTYCSDKCRKQAIRAKSDAEDAVQSPNSDKVTVEHPLKSDNVRVTAKSDKGMTGSDESYLDSIDARLDAPATQAEIDNLPDDVRWAIASEPEEQQADRTQRAVRYQRLFSEPVPTGNLELCKYCAKPLPKLEQPRKHTGCCLCHVSPAGT